MTVDANRVSDEQAEALADREWWQTAGDTIGLRLVGWTYRDEAQFLDSHRTVILPGTVAERLLSLRRSPSLSGGEEAWQPAETAPRDGSEFIARNEGFMPFSCQFWQGEFVHFEPDDGPIRYAFTHWLPMEATCNVSLQVAGFDDAAWDRMREQIFALREGHRRKMNDAGGRAEMAAAAGDMAEVSINSTESERYREAFVALNVAIGIIDTCDPVLAENATTFPAGLQAPAGRLALEKSK